MKYCCLLLIVFLLMNCSKDPVSSTSDCEKLRQGLLNNNVSLVEQSLSGYMDSTYSEENLNQMAETITKSCDIDAKLLCFNCIQTLPAQSEMMMKFLSNSGDSTVKELDLSYTTGNKIRFVNIQ